MRRQIKQKNRCASHQKRSIVRPMLSVMAIQIALTAEELGKIVRAGIPSIGTRKAIYQLTVYFAKETVAFCMFLPAQPACGTPRQSFFRRLVGGAKMAQPACGTPRQRQFRVALLEYPEGTTCVRYAEAKRTAGAMQLSAAAAQPACGTPRQSTFNVAASKAHWAQPACGTPRQSFFVLVGLRSFAGTTCVRYATKASKKTGLARLFGYIRIFVRKPTVFSIWLL